MIPLSPTLRIALSLFERHAVGGTIEERFRNIIKREHVSEACFMTTSEDEQFRAAVGALMVSYGPGTPEFERIEAEMLALRRLSVVMAAAEAGMAVRASDAFDEKHEPIGLVGMWRERER